MGLQVDIRGAGERGLNRVDQCRVTSYLADFLFFRSIGRSPASVLQIAVANTITRNAAGFLPTLPIILVEIDSTR